MRSTCRTLSRRLEAAAGGGSWEERAAWGAGGWWWTPCGLTGEWVCGGAARRPMVLAPAMILGLLLLDVEAVSLGWEDEPSKAAVAPCCALILAAAEAGERWPRVEETSGMTLSTTIRLESLRMPASSASICASCILLPVVGRPRAASCCWIHACRHQQFGHTGGWQ
jgi:hypothetical protein